MFEKLVLFSQVPLTTKLYLETIGGLAALVLWSSANLRTTNLYISLADMLAPQSSPTFEIEGIHFTSCPRDYFHAFPDYSTRTHVLIVLARQLRWLSRPSL